MATTTKTPTKKTEPKDAPVEPQAVSAEEIEAQKMAKQDSDAVVKENADALEILEPDTEPKQWIIGKPPEHGGTDDEYSIYVQEPLPYLKRLRFGALVTKAITDSMKATGGDIGSDLFGAGSMRERARELSDSDFSDAGSFMQLAFELSTHVPDFLLDCYVMWLNVPPVEKVWAKRVMEQNWNPDKKKWGLTDEQHEEIVLTFIEQNYDGIREFLSGNVPRLAEKVKKLEKARKDRESGSAQLKQ